MTLHDYLSIVLLTTLGLAVSSWAQVFYAWLIALRTNRDAKRIGQGLFLVYWVIAASGGLLCMFAAIIVIRVLRLGTKPVTTIEEAAGFIVVAIAVLVFYVRRRWLCDRRPENVQPSEAGGA